MQNYNNYNKKKLSMPRALNLPAFLKQKGM